MDASLKTKNLRTLLLKSTALLVLSLFSAFAFAAASITDVADTGMVSGSQKVVRVSYTGNSHHFLYLQKQNSGSSSWGTLNSISSAPSSGYFEWPLTQGTYKFRLKYCQKGSTGGAVSCGYSSSRSFTLAADTPPALSPISNLTINEDSSATINFTITDGDSPLSGMTFHLTQSGDLNGLSGLPAWSVSGTGSSRTLTITPAANEYGTPNLRLMVFDDTGRSDSEDFVLTVNPVNDAPTISNITNKTINEDSNTGYIEFDVNDIETSNASLTISKSSSNQTLVPTGNISVISGSTSSKRKVRVTPAANKYGSATITLTVSDGTGGTRSDSFVVTVNSVNDLPTVTNPGTLSINEDASGTKTVTVNDIETSNTSLTVTAASNNQTLVPNSAITVSKPSSNTRNITINPAANQNGTAAITVKVQDSSGGSRTTTFNTVVAAVNDTPTVGSIGTKTISEDSNTGYFNFSVNDIEDSNGSLTVSASSSNTSLIDSAGISIRAVSGNSNLREIRLTPKANKNGSATIQVKAKDSGAKEGTRSFVLNVNSVNDVPTITNPGTKNFSEDTTSGSFQVTVNDVETSNGSLRVTGTSSNQNLIANNGISITKPSDANKRNIVLTPKPNASGSSVITLKVSDGSATREVTFNANVAAVNDPPVISTIQNQETILNAGISDIGFTITDVDDVVTASDIQLSSNKESLISTDDISVSFSGTSGSLSLQPKRDQSGTAIIQLTVDGVSRSFSVLVESFDQAFSGIDFGETTTDPSWTPPSDDVFYGALAGSHSVGNDGSFNYSIPIQVPPGINGVQPNLSLSYNSNRRNGIVGYGWALGGLSVISRCPASTIRDGYISTTDPGANYKYCLDGQRLVEVAYNEYRTEKESFLRITKQDGSDSWTVTDNAGNVSRYGYGASSKIEDAAGETYSWYLDKKADDSGNYYSVSYTKSGTSYTVHRVNEISYTLNDDEGLNSQHTIEFSYSSRPDTITRYVGGEEILTSTVLNKITVKTNDERNWVYDLDYEIFGENYYSKTNSDPAKTSRLSKIKLCYKNDLQCVEPLGFEWSSQASSMYEYVNSDDLPFYPDLGNTRVQLIFDIDGNGSLEPYYAPMGEEFQVETTTVMDDESPWDIDPTVACAENFNNADNSVQCQKSTYIYKPKYKEVDVNADGYLDVVKEYKVVSGIEVFLNVKDENGQRVISDTPAAEYAIPANLLSWNGLKTFKLHRGVGPQGTLPIWRGSVNGYHTKETRFADLNRDGKIDIVILPSACYEGNYECIGWESEPLLVLFNTGDGWYRENGSLSPHNMGTVKDELSYQFIDLNGDGVVEMLSSVEPFPGVNQSGGGIYVSTNNGEINNGVFEYVDSLRGGAGLLGDFNGDGIIDSAHMRLNSSEIKVYVGEGGFEYADEYLAHSNNDSEVFPGCTTELAENWVCLRSVQDYNLDGLDDIVVLEAQKLTGSSSWCDRGTEGCGLDGKKVDYYPADNAQVYISQGGRAGGIKFAAPITYRSHDSVYPSNENRFPGKPIPYFVDRNGDGIAEDSTTKSRRSGFVGHKIEGVHSYSNELEVNYSRLRKPNVTMSLNFVGESRSNLVYQDQQRGQGLGVVSVLVKDLNGSNLARDSYSFSDAVYHRDGWGSLGFAKITKTSRNYDISSSFVTDTWYYQTAETDYKLAGLPKRKRVKIGSQILSDTRYQYKVRRYYDDFDGYNSPDYSAYSPHYFTYLSKSTSETWDLNGTPISSSVTRVGEPGSFNCTQLTDEDIDDDINSSLLVSDSDFSEVSEHGVTLFTSKTTCDAAQDAGVPTDSRVQIQATRNSNVTTAGSRRALVQKVQTYSWMGSDASSASLVNFSKRTVGLEYNSQGQLAKQKTEPDVSGLSALHFETSYTYNGWGSVSSTTEKWDNISQDGLPDAGQRITTVTESWDGAIKTVVSKAPLMPSETTVYHPVFGVPVSHTDVTSLTTEFEYDDLGREKRIDYADGTSTRTGFYRCGDCEESWMSNPKSKWYKVSKTTGSPVFKEGFDEFGRNVYQESRLYWGQPNFKTMSYNRRGLLVREYNWFNSNPDSDQEYSAFTYDNLGRVYGSTVAGITKYREYNGLRTKIQSYSYEESSNTKDHIRYSNSAGLVTRTLDEYNTPVDYSYWHFGELKSTVVNNDENTRINIYYDALGRKTNLVDPNAGSSSYVYNGLGLISQQTDANGVVTRFGYDQLGRQTARTDNATGTARTHSWSYFGSGNGVGQLASLSGYNTDGSAYSENYSYTNYGLLEKATRSFNNQSFSLLQHYDSFNRPLATTYPSGFTTVNNYNNQGYLTQIKSHFDNKALWTLTGTDAKGRTTGYTLGNGARTYMSYDPEFGLINTIRAEMPNVGTIMSHDYDFDRYGNLIRREDLRFGAVENFEYDGLNRLTEIDSTGSNESFTYDVLGNITSKTGVTGTYNYGTVNTAGSSSDAGPHAVTAANGLSYFYDAAGNITSVKDASNTVIRTVDYSAYGKPTRITNNGKSTDIVYDAEHNRIKRTDSDGRVTVYGLLGLYEQVTYGGTTEVIHYIGDFATYVQKFGVENDSYFEYMHRDHLGSVVAKSRDNLTSISDDDAFSFGVWGERRALTWDGFAEGEGYLPEGSARGFTDHEHLDGLGLIHMNGRVYDPTIGRFLSADPLIQAPHYSQSYNRYTYVFNNPLGFVDPSGYYSEDYSTYGGGAGSSSYDVVDDGDLTTYGYENTSSTMYGESAYQWGQNFSLGLARGMIEESYNEMYDVMKMKIPVINIMALYGALPEDITIFDEEDTIEGQFGRDMAPVGLAILPSPAGKTKAAKSALEIVKKEGVSALGKLSKSLKKLLGMGVLSKGDRIKMIVDDISKISANNADDALRQVNQIVDRVEDAHSGVKKVDNPGKAYDGRMYGPRDDSVTRHADGSITAKINKGSIYISPEGAVTLSR